MRPLLPKWYYENMYPVVYSYKKVYTRELELSIRSLVNLSEWNGEVYIVGDNPELPADIKFKHLPIAYNWGKQTRVRHNDEICAYLTARDVVGDFIAMADDHYILKTWSLMSHNKGTLVEHSNMRTRQDSYTLALMRTHELLFDLNKPTLSFEVHIPFLMREKELKEVEYLIPKSRQNILIRSLLGNYFERDSTKIDDVKDKEIDENTVLYSSSDRTFDYERVKKYATNVGG